MAILSSTRVAPISRPGSSRARLRASPTAKAMSCGVACKSEWCRGSRRTAVRQRFSPSEEAITGSRLCERSFTYRTRFDPSTISATGESAQSSALADRGRAERLRSPEFAAGRAVLTRSGGVCRVPATRRGFGIRPVRRRGRGPRRPYSLVPAMRSSSAPIGCALPDLAQAR
jgi:hypothetical protein